MAHIFEILNEKKEQKVIESYSLTQTTLEQIFVQLAGEDEDNSSDTGGNNDEQSKKVGYFIHLIELTAAFRLCLNIYLTTLIKYYINKY